MRLKFLLTILIATLVFTLVGCSKSITSSDTALAPFKVTDNNYTFTGTSPDKVKAGERFTVKFNLTNNGEVPVIGVNLRFGKLPKDIEIYADDNYGKVQFIPQIASTVLLSKNMNLAKGNSVSSKFDMVISQPGTYQVEINPDALAGDWRFIGTWIMTVVVSDSPEAQEKRKREADNQARLADNDKKRANIADIDGKMNAVNEQIEKLEREVNNLSFVIKNRESTIKNMETSRSQAQDLRDKSSKSVSSGYANSIDGYNKEIQNVRNQIEKEQQQIAQNKQKIQELSDNRISFMSQRNDIEKTII